MICRCSIENIRWDVDESIPLHGSYEAACDRLGLPHYEGGFSIACDKRLPKRDVSWILVRSLKEKYGREPISIEFTMTFLPEAGTMTWDD